MTTLEAHPRRLVRLVHRATGQIAREYDVTDLTDAELNAWFGSLARQYDPLRYAVETGRMSVRRGPLWIGPLTTRSEL